MRVATLFIAAAVLLLGIFGMAVNAAPQAWISGRYNQSSPDMVQFDNSGVTLWLLADHGVQQAGVLIGQMHTAGNYTPGGATMVREHRRRFNHQKRREQSEPLLPWAPNLFNVFIYTVANDTTPENASSTAVLFRESNFTTQPTWTAEPTSIILAELLPPTSQRYLFRISKATEPDWGLMFTGPNYVVCGGYELVMPNLLETVPPVTPLTPPPPPQGAVVVSQLPLSRRRRIEFVGDSLTADYCNLCPNPNVFTGENFVQGWSQRSADAFGADFNTEAWSCFGVIRNCDNSNTTTMSNVFKRTLATVEGSVWDWSRFVPDVFFVNLGANDHLNNTDPGPFEEQFVAAYTALMNETALRYASQRRDQGITEPLHMILACGSAQWPATWCPYVLAVKVALEEWTQRAVPRPAVEYHFLSFELPTHDHCCGHPNVEGDKLMAREVVRKVSDVTGWSASFF